MNISTIFKYILLGIPVAYIICVGVVRLIYAFYKTITIAVSPLWVEQTNLTPPNQCHKHVLPEYYVMSYVSAEPPVYIELEMHQGGGRERLAPFILSSQFNIK